MGSSSSMSPSSNTALNSIGSSLGGGVSELQWVVSTYIDRVCGR